MSSENNNNRLLQRKLRFVFIACGLSVLLGACGVGLTLGTRAMTEQLPVVTIPGAALPVELQLSAGLSLASPEIDLGSGENFVSFVRVRNLRLNIIEASDQDQIEDGALDSFDFLSTLDVSIRADFNGRTNELMIATLPDGDPQIASAARSLELTVVNSETDVLDFLLAPNGYDIVLGITGTVPADNVLISGEIRYRVGVGI